jgi:single-stranded-DNA-specific exonuclease
MKGMTEAVAQIRQTIAAGECIAVYGDYDADGVTATALMTQSLRALEAEVRPYIPDRFEEGYGLNKQAIAELAEKGVALIVTVDCGIRSVEEVAYGNELGLKFIITDHHQIPRDEAEQDVVPPAVAVLNPRQADCRYPFKDLAGVGVAFKLVQALRQTAADLPELQDENLLDLVAIGTVADMVPLVGENRMLVKEGLTYVNHPRRVGLQALIQQGGLKLGQITAGTIGFVIGPRLNAAGRLVHARMAYQLLSTHDSLQAQRLAMQLSQINTERQDMTHQFVDKARVQILQGQTLAPLYLITDPEFNHGVVGLVASRLTDEFYRPMLVAQKGEVVTKGSGRSIPEFDITRALDKCAHLLVKYGGHAAAAGFTIENKNLERFRQRLIEIARQSFGAQPLQKVIFIDAEINLKGVNYQLVKDIQDLQPFGYSNPKPRFVSRQLLIRHQTLVGKERRHLKLKLFDGKRTWDAIGFNMGLAWPSIPTSTLVDVVYTLEFNTWNGRTNLQLNLKDLKVNDH